MTNREIALKFIEYFCAAKVECLASLLSSDLQFTGPLFSYNSAADYLAALRDDPPASADFKIMHISENTNSVAVFWQYQKETSEHAMAQLFTFENGKISKIKLVFDASPFAAPAPTVG